MAEHPDRNWSLWLGVAITLAIVLPAALSLAWTPYPPAAIDIKARLQGWSPAHPLGTDPFGRDVLSLLMAGARNSIGIALGAVALSVGIGVPLGALAAARGGWLDDLLMRGSDLLFAFPAVLTAIMLAAALGPSMGVAILAIGLFNLPVFARVTRSAAVRIWPRAFVQAARLSGKSRTRITLEHILPNILDQLLVQVTLQLALAILTEAGLGYLGLSVPPPAPTLGRMLADAQSFLAVSPRLAILPGLAIALAVLGLNLLGDGLRDRLDPRLGRQP
ncbi:ABC transporter permease [Geminicoccus harenae]|uniref:ABC transporter permease n=1 Tax=Geminicoccus harenae TaxID=2498453 RepID=UPI00168AD168|nr:ABC transporter permease [Geminicoccus harenae]